MAKNQDSPVKVAFHKLHITPWVAMTIVGAIAGATSVIVWQNANESWVYDYAPTRYPLLRKTVSNVASAFSTIGWKTYRDNEYGFEIRNPEKYQATNGKIVSSLIGTKKDPVFGASVGPLIFVKAEEPALRQAAKDKFDANWNRSNCIKKAVNTGLDIKVVFCATEDIQANYALIKGKTFDIFVDGYSGGQDKELLEAYGAPGKAVSQVELLTMLSTFKFVINTGE